ncbi:hypothetical protein EJ05DRAFT_504521 [Pseudovirgaria hyperparasitica]|uniref:Arrestin-like N-terminal domain-containing protein n=1 Tax=Pseudovirgaria hyperparasitica TaxID=470096 RepID=A0A6A6VW41_9PEZI|nr:uncharacterized protein EJ05DRAFT_504521 [Pseudovirgaria hyperparasitica]KAF2753924.1 hypothetical protein EJ05DRAFT_504521 [Pseudovirgaria hyperparasitica]
MNSIHFEFIRPAGRTFFSPGDIVAGNCRVELNHNIAQQTARIDVVLSGRSEIRLFQRQLNSASVRLSYPGNSVTRLLEEHKTICTWSPGQYATTGHYVLPFQFMFPSRHKFAPTSNCLPPSTTHCGQTSQWSGVTRVVYEVEAQVFSWQGYCLRREASEITVSPFSWYPLPEAGLYNVTRHAEIESHHLDKPYMESDSLKKAMKRLTFTKTPIVHMDITIQMPSHATLGSSLPLLIGVEYDFQRSTTSELPPVWLTDLAIRIRENMEISQDLTNRQDPNSVVTRETDPYVKFHTNLKDFPVRITEQVDLRRVLPPDTLILKSSSFTSTMLRRFYDDISVTATIMCAQKSLQLEFTGKGELYIHPSSQPSMVQELAVPATDILLVSELMGSGILTPRIELPGGGRVNAKEAPPAELPFNLPPGGLVPSRSLAELP